MIISTEKDFKFPIIQYCGTDGKREYRMLDDYCFQYFEKGNWYRRTVFKIDPSTGKEDESDLASVPDPAVALGYEQAGCSDGASETHDNGCARRGKFLPGEFQILKDGTWVDCTEPYSRLRCDLLFFKMLRLGKMPFRKALTEFLAVRVGNFSTGRWYFS